MDADDWNARVEAIRPGLLVTIRDLHEASLGQRSFSNEEFLAIARCVTKALVLLLAAKPEG